MGVAVLRITSPDAEIVALKHKYKARLLVDDAHGSVSSVADTAPGERIQAYLSDGELTLDAHDPISKQPDYKKCAVRLRKKSQP